MLIYMRVNAQGNVTAKRPYIAPIKDIAGAVAYLEKHGLTIMNQGEFLVRHGLKKKTNKTDPNPWVQISIVSRTGQQKGFKRPIKLIVKPVTQENVELEIFGWRQRTPELRSVRR